MINFFIFLKINFKRNEKKRERQLRNIKESCYFIRFIIKYFLFSSI